MREEVFEEILRKIKLPLGELLYDGSTYRIVSDDFHKIRTRHKKELNFFDKFLILTYDQKIVGGVLFYGAIDIQLIIFPEYRHKHIMSEICKNGILKSECYPNQKATISTKTIESFDDFLMKHYLLSNAGIEISNLPELYKHFSYFRYSDNYEEIEKYSEELLEFIDPVKTHKFYWEKPIKRKNRPTHPHENDSYLPIEIRGKHFDSWTELARLLGYGE